MNYAGFWRRVGAYTLDIVPITAATAGVFYFYLGFGELWQASRNDPTLETLVLYHAERNLIRGYTFVIWLLFSMGFEASPLQGTPGKLMCGIKVVDRHGERITYGKSIYRNLAKLSAYVSFFIGFLALLFSPKKQTWHDRIADTFVVMR